MAFRFFIQISANLWLLLISASVFYQFYLCGEILSFASSDSQKKKTEKQETLINETPDRKNRDLFCLRVDALFLKPLEDSLSYVLRMEDFANIASDQTISGSFGEPKWKYDWGVRCGFLFPIGLDECSVGALWTYFNNSMGKSSYSSDAYDLYTILSQVGVGDLGNAYVNNASGKWKLDINVFDLVANKSIRLNNNFVICPFAGIEGAIISQSSKVSYTNYFISNPYATSPQNVNGNNRTWGVGPKIGVEFSFAFPGKLKLGFSGSYASLFGLAKSNISYFNMLTLSPDTTISLKATEKRLFQATFLSAYLSKSWEWDVELKEKNPMISLLLGWETQVWFKQLRLNYFSSMNSPSSGSDLTLQGPTGRFSVTF